MEVIVLLVCDCDGGSNQMDGWIGSERVRVKGTIGWLPNSNFNISAN